MADYTATTSKHATLAPNAADAVTLDRCPQVEILNRGTVELYFTTNGKTPTVAGDGTYVVQPGAAVTVPSGFEYRMNVDRWEQYDFPVRLVAAESTPYSITAVR